MTTAPAPDRLAAALARLGTLHPKVIDLSLGRVAHLLAKLGNPERQLPPVVHVAGTNGKGSFVAYMRAFLEAAGHRVHAYTSPHLVRFNERIRLAGHLISDDALIDALARCEQANDGAAITFFEITTAAAFLAFAQTPADVVLLETGLGGRLDATNLVETPALVALTPVSIDHVQFLGSTISAIAAEKAGIIKARVPLLIGEQRPEARDVMLARAKALEAPAFLQGPDFSAVQQDDRLLWQGFGEKLLLPLPALRGQHQISNAALAIAAARQLPRPLRPDDAALATGLRQVEWPARMQRLHHGPIADLMPPGSELWLDGGHNAAAGEALGAWLAEEPHARPVDLICGMLNSKAAVDFLRPFAPHVRHVATIGIPGEANAYGAEELAAMARSVGLDARAAHSVEQAAEEMLAQDAHIVPRRLLIAGSLYLAGYILRTHR